MKKLFLVIYCVFCASLFGQKIVENGNYNNILFSTDDFGSTTQIWTGDQHINGNVYFGNDNAILEYNGVSWRKIVCDSAQLSFKDLENINSSKVNKIFTAKNGVTFAARTNTIGKLIYNKTGSIVYAPLAKNASSGEFISVYENKLGKIFFFAQKKLLIIHDKQIESINYPKELEKYDLRSSTKLGQKVLMEFKSEALDKKAIYLCDLPSKTFSKYPSVVEDKKVSYISGHIELKNEWLVFSGSSDVFSIKKSNHKIEFSKRYSDLFIKNSIYNINSIKTYNNQILIATENGFFVLRKDLSVLREFGIENGMESLFIYDFFKDREHNLWLCLDNGIHFFETSSPLTYFNKTHGITERIYQIDFDNNQEFLANNSVGIFEAVKNRTNKKYVLSNIINQGVYDVNTFYTSNGKKTLAVASDGLYEIDYTKKDAKLIVKENSWKIFQSPENKNEFYVGNNSSLGKLSLNNGAWDYEILIPNLDGKILNLTYSKGNIIFGVENIGIYIYNIKSKLFKTIKNDIKTNYYVESFNNRVYIGINTGLYFLNRDNSNMLPFIELDRKFIGDTKFSVFRLFNENDKNLWVVSYNETNEGQTLFEIGWLNNDKDKWVFTSWPLVGINIQKGEAVCDIKFKNENEIWFGASKGLFILNKEMLKHIRQKFQLSLSEIEVNNKIIAHNILHSGLSNEYNYMNNSLKFSFSPNSYYGINHMKYRFKLENYTDSWSDWSELNFANFQKLYEGKYTLMVQAKNCYGFESQILKYNFRILPPWYRTWWAYTLYAIGLVILVYFITQISIQRVKNQNLRLEAVVKERTSEIAEQNKVLEVQKVEIEQKTKDIVDSIVYAKRIQETILPTDRLPELFKDYFVFYRPKDIVSGDFYWARKKGDKIIFAAIDCTGHGVPGALVSIVGNSALLRCVNEHRLIEPSEILDKLREIVVRSFDSKGQQDVKDGMDMSLCTLDTKTNILKYAGANNECVIIRNKEIIELKPDKQPIGYFSHAVPFNQHEFQLQPGDSVYQFTDGYVDQFGGDKGKKLKSRPFKEFLAGISHLPMSKQAHLVQDKFEKWKEHYDQVDDVCVFAIKIV